jgi:hypothetical protein
MCGPTPLMPSNTAAAVGLYCLVAAPLAAQSTSRDADNPPPRPTYQPYRYDEDWSPLRDPRLRTDAIDGLKYVPLRDRPNWYLSIGGETRWRSQTIIELDAQLTTHLGMLTSLAFFHTGPFLSSMKDVRYLAAQAAYRF